MDEFFDFDNHKFMKYEFVDKETGKPIQIDLKELMNALGTLSVISRVMTNISDDNLNDLNLLHGNIRQMYFNQKDLARDIENFAQRFLDCFEFPDES